MFVSFFFFNDTATTEIYTLSLHDALPILSAIEEPVITSPFTTTGGDVMEYAPGSKGGIRRPAFRSTMPLRDRKSTRLNSSHLVISYAVFCLKKKKKSTCRRTYDIVVRQYA